MKKLAIIFIAIFGMTFAFNNVNAQNEAELTNASAAANIIAPITLEQITGLHFGDIVPTATAGDVIVSSAGVRSNPDGFTTLLTQFTIHSAAQFKVTGTDGSAYTIALPGDGVVVLDGAGLDIPVNGFEFTGDETIGAAPAGEDLFTVGATLEVGAGQAAGLYTGVYTVTVTYD